MKPFRIAETFVDDARYAAASMRANSGFAAAVALTLALGIGTVTAMFSVVDRLLLRAPSHISDVGQVRRIFAAVPGPDGRERIIPWFPYPAYAALRVGHTFAAVAAYAQHTTVIGRGADARPVAGASATSDFFPLLGTRPFMGRLFAPTDDDPRALAQVVILSYEFWQREFNGSPAALGKMLPVDDRAFTIIGVLPPGFTGTELGKTDFWIPMQAESTNWATSWSRGFINIVVRVTHGSAEEALARDATSRMNDAAGTGLWSYARLAVRPISSDRHGNLPAVFAVAKWLGAVALVVLLIVCANVANLLLARALDRRRETAVRLALGASTSRLMRLIATESLIITCIGGAGGLLLALVGGEAIRQRFLADIVWDAGVVDGRSLAVAASLTILAALVTSVFPMLQAGGTDVMTTLKSGARGGGVVHNRVRMSLLVAESALAVALMVTAGLFVRSLANVRNVDLEFDPQRVLSVGIDWAVGSDSTRYGAELQTVRARVASLPEYEHAALAIGSPFGGYWNFSLKVPGHDSLPTLAGPWINAVTPDYFATVGTRLVRGRLFAAGEGAGTEPVTVVGETMARALWPDEDPLGHCMLIGSGANTPCSRVVGVVRDAKQSALREPPQMQYYVPLGQERSPVSMTSVIQLLVRPRNNATDAIASLRQLVVRDLPDARFVRIAVLQDRIDPLIRPWRIGAELFGLFGVLALIVAGTGLYSVVAYITAQRTHEFGVRIALGARGRHVLRVVMSDSARAVVIGIPIGVAGPLLAARWLNPLLFDESVNDFAVIGAVGILVAIVTLVASAGPARCAMRVDPLMALRVE